MKPVQNHAWDISPTEAVSLQKQLAPQVITEDIPNFSPRFIAGVDVAYIEDSPCLFAAVVVLRADDLSVVDMSTAYCHVQFPYVPTLFSFRELPPIMAALSHLTQRPDLIICDGQGRAHPQRFGLASHLGVLYDVPTIGCAKKSLIGQYEPPAEQRGAYTILHDDNGQQSQEVIGQVVRTQVGIKPIFVSVGHRISLDTARHWVVHCSPHYRLPETTRQADQAVNYLKRCY